MKEIIKKYAEENCLSRRGRNPRCFREAPQTLFWMIINFFLTIILWRCLCLITHVFLTCVTGIIWRATVMIKPWKRQLLPTCSSKHRAGSVRRQCCLLIRSELLFHVEWKCSWLLLFKYKRCQKVLWEVRALSVRCLYGIVTSWDFTAVCAVKIYTGLFLKDTIGLFGSF